MSSSANSLRPAWHRGSPSGGRGFQPPPTVASERARSQSIGSSTGSGGGGALDGGRRDSNLNAFAALDDDDEVVLVAVAAASGTAPAATSAAAHTLDPVPTSTDSEAKQSRQSAAPPPAKSNSRSEALRSATAARSMSTGSKAPGRTLADLAARSGPDVPTTTTTRSLSTAGGAHSGGGSGNGGGAPIRDGGAGGGGTGRFGHLRPTDSFDSSKGASAPAGDVGAKIVRYTRERLLSMRPASRPTLPPSLAEFAGTVIVSEEPQDPVCWETFEAEVIWATVRRASAKGAGVEGTGAALVGGDPRRGSTRSSSTGAGRWQRGVALPPPDQAKKGREREADSPNELWDDPKAAGAGGLDFSSFGAMPDDPIPFSFEKMAEESRKLEEELHGSYRSRASSDAESADLAPNLSTRVDPKRPLASAGTTIQSGSGDEVNVFEDFGDPGASEESEPPGPAATKAAETPTIRGAGQDPSASSRLMAMIGVNREVEPSTLSGSHTSVDAPSNVSSAVSNVSLSPWADSGSASAAESTALSMNPWGTSLLPSTSSGSERSGMVTAASSVTMQAQMRGAAELEEQKRVSDERRRRQEHEDAQRRLALQREEEERVRQAAALQQQQQQQQAGVQSQVELVLMERITTFLENSWGRSDLISILTTLHSEDSRVIPLLSTVDALRALILRHPRRINLRHDPSVGAELAILTMTNVQWQQHLQQEAQTRAAQAEELRLREQRQLEEQQQRAAAAQAAAAAAQRAAVPPPLSPTAPWYYSDPQNNIQGPFRANEMRQWLEAGYFKGDLPISQQPSGPFRPLVALFPNLSSAFVLQDTAADAAAVAAAAAAREAEEEERREAERLRAEAESRAREEATQRERERERQAKEAAARDERERLRAEEAERARREAEKAEASKNANGGNESSEQLKMMLGLSSQASAAVAPVQTEKKADTIKAKPKAAAKSAATQQRSNSVTAPVPEVKPSAPVSSPWGGAAVQSVQRKSMSEIQKEEARAAAALKATEQEGTRSSTGGWANVAAARVSNSVWAGGAAKPLPSAAAAAAASVTKPGLVPTIGGATKPRQASVGTAQSVRSSMSDKDAAAAAASAAEEFGAKMSPALEKWCKEQMTTINKTEDLTLVSFCMTLNDPNEIRQYLTAYLGSSPAVNKFATDFINKRGLGSLKQEEWETTATAKKTRKGKKK